MSDHAAIEQVAASWLMRRSERDWSDQDESLFTTWMDESMAHKAAFWRLEYGYAQLDRLSALPGAEPLGAVRWLFAARAFAMAASIVVLLAVGYLVVMRSASPRSAQPEWAHYSTRFGQVETVVLADGSSVELNTDSSIRVAMDRRQRSIRLERGEAYFAVAHDADRPFVIRADPAAITAVGTKFSVFRQLGKVKVAVLEGRVRLDRPMRAGAGSLMLVPGDVGVTDGRSIEATSLGVKRIGDELAWREGMARFDNIRLADAAAEFNRYNRRKLTIADPRAQDLRIGGAFRLGNVDGFARLVNQSYGVKLRIGPPADAQMSH